MANQTIPSQGTVLSFTKTAPTANSEGAIGATEYAMLDSSQKVVNLVASLATVDSSTPTQSTPVLDAIGSVVGAGSTVNATVPFTVYTTNPRSEGYMLVREAKEALSVIYGKIIFPDGSIKYFPCRIETAAESTPIGDSFQMAVSMAVTGPVVTTAPVAPTT